MEHIAHIPNSPLSLYVDAIWVGNAPNLKVQAVNHPFLHTEIIFNHGDVFEVTGENIAKKEYSTGRLTISGLKTSSFYTTVSGKYSNFGLLLKPFCYGLIKKRSKTPTFDKLILKLHTVLLEKNTPDFNSSELYLMELFEDIELDKSVISFAQNVNADYLQKGSLKQYTQSLSITQKNFINKFKKLYSLTPSQFIRLSQVNQAIELMKTRIDSTLTEIGFEAGFYDQSHFIRVFKNYCGLTPKEFRDRI